MKKIIFLLPILLIFVNMNKVKSVNIPSKSIRIRVIANSNSKIDQEEKIKLSINIEKYVQELLKNTISVKEADKIIKENITNINNEIKKYTNDYKLMYGKNFFPEKRYKGVIYKEGYYDSIVIKIGSGKGKNWWCVLFPPLCLMETDENIEDNKYKFYIKEIIDRYF